MGLESLITGFAHVGIRVRDLARSRVFYEGLGFEFENVIEFNQTVPAA